MTFVRTVCTIKINRVGFRLDSSSLREGNRKVKSLPNSLHTREAMPYTGALGFGYLWY